ncbi:MAG: glycoside hydrolase family 3 N-terminal domain-containing protein [Flavobacteriales bacterium]
MKKRFILFVLIFVMCTVAFRPPRHTSLFHIDDQEQRAWVDSIYNIMSLDEKIGQLFTVAAYSNKGAQHRAEIERLIREEHIGGLIFFQNDAVQQALLTNAYQSLSKVPLWIGIDAEWGLNMRLKNGYRFPWAMTFGAVADDSLVYQVGGKIAQHCKRLGIHINFAPDADVNTNPQNPIIGNRSFGSDVDNVSRKAIAYARGMNDAFVIATAKHFPGHGDTQVDSHKGLPMIQYPISRLDSVEIHPFKRFIEAKGAGIVVGHLLVPALDSDPNLPASISSKIVTGILKNRMGFTGLLFTDALDMKAVSNLYPPEEVNLKAFQAGNDVLLFARDVKTSKKKILNDLNKTHLSMERLESSVKKILTAKYWVGLHRYRPIKLEGLVDDLNDPESEVLHRKIVEKAVTVLKNDQDLLPIKKLANIKLAYVPLEEGDNETFYTYLSKYAKIDKISIGALSHVSKLEGYDAVFVGIHKSNANPWKSYKVSKISKSLLNAVAQKYKVVLSIFASPYSLIDLDLKKISTVVLGYQNSKQSQSIVPQVIFGALGVYGHLPVDINEQLKVGQGITYNPLQRLGYGIPEAEGMSSQILNRIEDLVRRAIEKKSTPGAQVLVARNGKVVYEKSFGYFTYDQIQPIQWQHVYDVASVTKVAATLPLMMQQVENGRIDLDLPIGRFIKAARSTNKSTLTLREILTHQASLKPWIAFYKKTLDADNQFLPGIYSDTKKENYTTHVAENLYIKDIYNDLLMQWIYKTPVSKKGVYKYSDLGFYILRDHFEKSSGVSLAELVRNSFYKPLGTYTTGYIPLDQFSVVDIVPTKYDNTFRKQMLRGYAHDPGAAMLGGVSGHAGLFSNANDLAKIMQMYLQGGYYGGKRYLQAQTVKKFTSYQYKKNRRGLGFDKPQREGDRPYSSPYDASPENYGHRGFTGTMVWADPVEQIVYVFLSNHVQPSSETNLLLKLYTRSEIQNTIYQSIVKN